MPTPPTARPGISQSTEPPTPISATATSSSAWPDAEGQGGEGDPATGAEPAEHVSGAAGADHVGDRHRGEDGARGQRAEAAAVLEVERQHQEVRRHAGEQQELTELPRSDGTAAHRLDVNEGSDPAAAQRDAPEAGEDGEHRGTAEGLPGPQRPTLALPLDQRQHECGQRADHEDGLEDVRARGGDPGVRQQPRRGDEGGDADRHVDQEDRPPAGAGEVQVDQQPADQLAGGGGHAHDRGVGAERADPLRPVVHVPDEGEHGGSDHGRRGALDQPGDEQRVHVGCEAADGRAEHEQARAEQEHPPAAPAVGEPAGHQQEAAEGECVAGDQPLEGGGVGVQVLLHGRQRDVDDEEVEDDQEDPGQQDRKRPSPEGGCWVGDCVHGDCSPASRNGRVNPLSGPLDSPAGGECRLFMERHDGAADHRRLLADDVPDREGAAPLPRRGAARAGADRPEQRLPLLPARAGRPGPADPPAPRPRPAGGRRPHGALGAGRGHPQRRHGRAPRPDEPPARAGAGHRRLAATHAARTTARRSASATATSPPPWCWPSAATSTATRRCRGGSRRSPSCTGCSAPPASAAPGRTAPSSRPSSSPRAPPSWWPSSRSTGCRRWPAGSRPSPGPRCGTPWPLHDGPMVDLDGAYSAVGQTVVEEALASDGPVVERYLPLGDEDDLLAHHTEVCWPVSG